MMQVVPCSYIKQFGEATIYGASKIRSTTIPFAGLRRILEKHWVNMHTMYLAPKPHKRLAVRRFQGHTNYQSDAPRHCVEEDFRLRLSGSWITKDIEIFKQEIQQCSSFDISVDGDWDK
ncbi:hypothetical protein K1719_014380 [Acacia pycnantha]|nr:hypothetical protein K1719_014380 [Acacia pycnantha]